MLRNTNTEKWKDAWFTELKPIEKLVFVFLTENCDIAGFYEVNMTLMGNLIGISQKELKNGLNAIRRSFLTNHKESETRRIWLKKFLLHQNCLPLKSDNADHMKMKFVLESHYDDFECPIEMLQIIDSVVTPAPAKKSTGRKKFKAPEWKDFWEYYQTIYDNEEAAKGLFDHYLSVGWRVGNKPMADWKAAIRKNIPRHKQQNGDNPKQGSGKKPSSRTQNLENASEEFLSEGMHEE